MKKILLTITLFCYLLLISNFLFAHYGLCNNPEKVSNPDAMHLYYFENKGQWDSQVQYKVSVKNADIYLENNGLTYNLIDPLSFEQLHECKHRKNGCNIADFKVKCYALKLNFLNSNIQKNIVSIYKSNFYNNYFLGKNANKWAGGVYGYQEIWYNNLYKNIDARYYSTAEGMPKYDMVVHKNGKVADIKWQYEGAKKFFLKDNALHIETTLNTVIEAQPFAYQNINGKQIQVPCFFSLQKNNTIGFELPKGYNPEFDLIIDPVLVFSTYSGSTADNWGFTATYDPEGHLYAGGIAFGIGYPTTTGAYDASFNGNNNDGTVDMSISKFSPDGKDLLYSTYIGGTQSDMPHSLVVNSKNELVIMGSTGSSNFPSTAGTYDASFNGGTSATISSGISFPDGSDIVVLKLAADGKSLLGSTFVGGSKNDGLNLATILQKNYADDVRGEVIVDANDDIFVASNTYSTNFPTTTNAAETQHSGDQDGCVFKLSGDLKTLIWSTFVGSTKDDAAYSLKVDDNKNVFACGGTKGTLFDNSLLGFDNTFNGVADGFLVKINAQGTAFLSGTYLGTDKYDQTFFVEIDKQQFIYTVGQTLGTYPVSNGVYNNPNSRQFIHKLSNDLSTSQFSTIFGSNNGALNISPTAFLVDRCKNIYVAGWGSELNEGTTNGLPTTNNAYQKTTDGNDFYFMVLGPEAATLEYATFMGGNGLVEHVDGGTSRFDKEGIMYEAVCAGCGGSSNFPTSQGVWSNTNNASNCNLAAVKFSFELAGLGAEALANPSAEGCVPFTVNFKNKSTGTAGLNPNYFWDFGDGNTSTQQNPAHTYTQAGTYQVMFIIADPNSCNLADTTFLTIKVKNPTPINASFNWQLTDPCELQVKFNSSPNAGNHKWWFGDGSTSSEVDPLHTYAAEGTYEVKLLVKDDCAIPDTVTKTITIDIKPRLNAAIQQTDSSGCEPLTVFLIAQNNAQGYQWIWGDGTTTQGVDATHTYNQAGIYQVFLVATDSNSCNINDTLKTAATIEVFNNAIADFTSNPPTIAETTLPVIFTNKSLYSNSYIWDFGDNTPPNTETNPTHIYVQKGTYSVCLIAQNEYNCNDTICKPLNIIPQINIGVPNAFSPNGDATNDVLYVEGNKGIERMAFRIFNRWGQLVFETNDPQAGWDGTFKGQMQEIEVYVYVVDAVLVSQRRIQLQGNVTLLR